MSNVGELESGRRENGLRLVHETPRRLRFKLPFLSDPLIDFSFLQTWLESISGVECVRINRYGRSLIFDYNGEAASRAAILAFLAVLRRDQIPNGEAEPLEEAELTPLFTSAGLIGLLPFLSPTARVLVTLLNIGSTLVKGLDTLLSRGVKVEVLDAVAIGLSASKGQYFTANVTDFLLKLGGYLETKTERQSDAMLRRLLRPKPTLTWVEREGGLIQVPDDQLQRGERIQVGPGERIPVDGLVLTGTAQVSQAAVTGESVPVRKEVMDRVIAGTLLEEGHLRIEARHVGDETTTARIAQFIDKSLQSSSESQRLAEKLADRRVYITLGTGGLVYLLTGEERRLESVFLVDYSCALKLGTPLAVKSGMYRAATDGILIKGGEAMEHLAAADTVVFDKTGTLTYSELKVTDVEVLDKAVWPRKRLLAVTASIEEHASHPVAEAITRKAREEHLNHIEHGEVQYLVAHGMICQVNNDRLLIGSRHFLEEHEGVDFSSLEADIARLSKEGKTLLYVGTQKEPIGLIALQDRMRDDAAQVVRQLRSLGIEHLVMITGDNRNRANALAAELGIDEVYAEQAPEEKAGIIDLIRAEGRRVAYVGDGVNDGPAMVAADVGIALSKGAELTRATADMVLLEDQLSLLLDATQISRRTMRLVETNYRAAIGINTGVMLGAAMGWLSPVVTAVLHNGTTIGLLLQALRGVDKVETPDS